MIKNKKEGIISYVLVVDVSDNGQLYYYEKGIPVNTNNYIKSMKIPFRDESEYICNKINKESLSFKYHVEEHGYM